MNILPSPASSPAATPEVVTTTVSEPVVQQLPVEPEEAPTEEAATTGTTSADATTPAATPAPAPEQEAPVTTTSNTPAAPAAATTTDAAEEAAIVPPVPVPAAQPQIVTTTPADSAVSNDNLAGASILAIFASVLGMLGLGVLGFVAYRRSRREPVPQIERPSVSRQPPAAPEVKPVTSTIPAKGVATPVVLNAQKAQQPRNEEKVQPERDIRDWAQPAPSTPAPSVSQLREGDAKDALPHAGAAIALPRTAPKSPEAREDLLRRMAAAKPDRANPFRSHKARRRRARLILQSLGHTFANGKSRIDFSQYPLNWPELANTKTVAA